MSHAYAMADGMYLPPMPVTGDDARHAIMDLLPRVRRFAWTLTRDMENAADLTHDTYIRAISNIDKWQPGTRLDSWLFKIAQNIWLDQCRISRRRGAHVEIEERHAPLLDGISLAEHKLLLSETLAMVAEIAPDHFDCVALVCCEGYSYQEAAHRLGVPIGTVLSRIARIRYALKQRYGNEFSIALE
jgi:RNA polymerase sigma-70 factor (ECF subfamily)